MIGLKQYLIESLGKQLMEVANQTKLWLSWYNVFLYLEGLGTKR